jgi:hypothetical protein
MQEIKGEMMKKAKCKGNASFAILLDLALFHRASG